jgi:antitoxin HicB
MIYLIDVEKDTDGSLLATCRAFPELVTFGEDRKDVQIHAVGALEEALAARIADGEPIPDPATPAQLKRSKDAVWVKLPLMTTLKVGLYETLRRSGITRAELARRLGWKRESVDRLFRLDHASRTEQIEAALRALNREVDVTISGRAEAAA